MSLGPDYAHCEECRAKKAAREKAARGCPPECSCEDADSYSAGWEAGRVWQRRVAYLDVQSFCERRLDEWDNYGKRPQVDRVLYEDISQKLLGRNLVGRNMWHEATDAALFKGPISEIRMVGNTKIFVHTNSPGAALVIEPGGWIELERPSSPSNTKAES